MNLAEQGFSQKFYPFINQRNIEGILAELELAYKHLARNGSDRLIMLDLSLKLIQLLRT
jgi:DNA polymerase-3 subunit delta'